MSIVIFLVILAVLILVHEFGHFIVAKKSGARVEEFGLGFPPRLFGIRKGETLYSFNAIPFGGFVKIFGENPNEVSEEALKKAKKEGKKININRSFTELSRPMQAAIVVAGVFFNLLLAWVLISIGFMSGLPVPVGQEPEGAVVQNIQLTITGVEASSPAEAAGIRAGDRILGAEAGSDILDPSSFALFQEFITSHGEEEITLSIKRGSEDIVLAITPAQGIAEERPAIGVFIDMIGTVSLNPIRALWEGAKMTILLTGATISAFAGLIVSAFAGDASLSNLTGPVGIVGLVGNAADFGFVYLLSFTAFISINLAVINLLPIPALDGGRLLFIIIEAIKGSPMNPRAVGVMYAVSFLALILLMVVVTYYDIIRIVGA